MTLNERFKLIESEVIKEWLSKVSKHTGKDMNTVLKDYFDIVDTDYKVREGFKKNKHEGYKRAWFELIRKYYPPKKVKEQNENIVFKADLSSNSWVEYTKQGVIIKNTVKDKGVARRIVYKGIFSPIKKLTIDGKFFFMIDLQERIVGNMKDVLTFIRSHGGVLGNNDLNDSINALLSSVELPHEEGYSAIGVYNKDDKLFLCLDPYSITDEQGRIERQTKKAKGQMITKEAIQSYIDTLDFWHFYEVAIPMSYGIIAPFGYTLKEIENFLVPYPWNNSPENGIGKSLSSRIFSQKLYGVKSQSMASVYSDFRLADSLDSFCGPLTLDEAGKYNLDGRLGEKIKQSAENPYQDKRGTSNLSTRAYKSRLICCFTGNTFPITGKSNLVRFFRVEFDSSMKQKRSNRDSGKELLKLVRNLKPIGFRLVENELKDLNYDVKELVKRIEKYADQIVECYSSFSDSRRPTSWGLVYEGLMAWQRICQQYGVKWNAPSIEDFVKDVVSKIEKDTFESKRIPLEDFIEWFEGEYLVKDKFSGLFAGIGHKTEDITWKKHKISYNGKDKEGYFVTYSVLKLYNKANRESEIKSLGDLRRAVSSKCGIPVDILPQTLMVGKKICKGSYVPLDIQLLGKNHGKAVNQPSSSVVKDLNRTDTSEKGGGKPLQQEKNQKVNRLTDISDPHPKNNRQTQKNNDEEDWEV